MILKIVSFSVVNIKIVSITVSCCHAFVMILGPAIEVSTTTVYHLLKGSTLPSLKLCREAFSTENSNGWFR